ncbi:MAG TPA: hypothetical protein DDZ89_14980, partial [Clostridiales bacterium]|nr:hypothetical protein [Clostridiales bacterium]
MDKDIKILKELAKEYAEISQKDVQNERRRLWAAHNAFHEVRPPIYIRHAAWLTEVVGDKLQCEDGFYRRYEYFLRCAIFHDTLDDDYIIEPWIAQKAVFDTTGEDIWGLPVKRIHTEKKSVTKYVHPIKNPEDFAKIIVPTHEINWDKTNAAYDKLKDALDGIIEVCIDTTPLLNGFYADLSTVFGRLRGFENMLWDMVDRPEWLHEVMAFMRDGVLKVQQEAEDAGHYTLLSNENQSMPYLEGLEPMRANSRPVKRNEIWGFMAAQEFAGVSPQMHDEFLLQYQMPIMEKYGAIAYGCCEDYTHKIDMLRQVKNLRRIAVSPFAQVEKCAEQIGGQYIASWRPSPSAMVSSGFDPAYIRKHITENIKLFQKYNCRFDIC